MLLLCCSLDDGLVPLTTAQFRQLSVRVRSRMGREERHLREEDFRLLGYDEAESRRLYSLVCREDALMRYLERGKQLGIVPLTRLDPAYPSALWKKLGDRCPPVLFAAGNLALLQKPMAALIGSRKPNPDNAVFAEKLGAQMAAADRVLVSGGARGCDTLAQRACLTAGGSFIGIVPDALDRRLQELIWPERMLYLAEGGYDLRFSSARAHSRNRLIHALPDCVWVAQTGWRTGGTWTGTMENLRHGWSPVKVYADGSPGSRALLENGAKPADGSEKN